MEEIYANGYSGAASAASHVFPADAQVWMNDYSYGPGYYLAVGWMLIMNFSLRAVFRHVAGTNFRNPKKKPEFWLRFT